VKPRPGVGHEGVSVTEAGSPTRLDAAALFREHAPFVAGFVRRLGVPEAEVDDVVQEVFVVTHRRGGYVPGPAKPRSWLAQIAVNVSSVARRTARRRRTESDEETVARAGSDGASPFDVAAAVQSLTRVQRALDSMDLEHRAVLVLFELVGETCEEIAAALEVPVGTVHSRLHVARARFKKEYERQGRARTAPIQELAHER
jgi:RNA polymerase sigma-70 factor, ECF subfamily